MFKTLIITMGVHGLKVFYCFIRLSETFQRLSFKIFLQLATYGSYQGGFRLFKQEKEKDENLQGR